MNFFRFSLLAVIFFSTVSPAHSSDDTGSVPAIDLTPEPESERSVNADQGSTMLESKASAPCCRFLLEGVSSAGALSFTYNVTPKFGVGFWTGSIKKELYSSEGGNLDAGQYYSQTADLSGAANGLQLIYRPGDKTLAESGFYLGLAWGVFKGSVDYTWGRYDRDPAFIIIGSDHRLLEQGSNSHSLTQTYLEPQLHYQYLISGSGVVKNFFLDILLEEKVNFVGQTDTFKAGSSGPTPTVSSDLRELGLGLGVGASF